MKTKIRSMKMTVEDLFCAKEERRKRLATNHRPRRQAARALGASDQDSDNHARAEFAIESFAR
jgi:hypothetical protein